MALHEMIKSVKIVDELLIYLVDKGYKKVKIDFELLKKEIRITATIDHPKDNLIEMLRKDVNADRESEIEEYGWELMGEDHHSCALQQVCMLIDRVEVNKKENQVELLLIRKM